MNQLSRIMIGGTAIVAGSMLNAASRPLRQAQDRPNIVMFVVDDHGTDAIGAYGNPVIKTPNIDSIAKDGVLFKRAHCTSASCSASRAALLTGIFGHKSGQYGHTHAYHHMSLMPNIKSLSTYLNKAGYRSAHIGKWHLAPDSAYPFDLKLKGKDHYRNPVQMSDQLKPFINESGEDPFFIYYCTNDPHRDGQYGQDNPYKPNCFGNRKKGYDGVTEVTYDPKEVIVPDFLPDSPECRAELTQYYQSISRVDQGVGRMIQNLKDAGEYENTIFIYISDNGAAFPGAKTTAYEPGIQLPLIIRAPGQTQRGVVSDALVSWVDIVPTLLDAAGVNYKPTAFQGKSFLKTMLENSPGEQQQIYASHTFHEITMYYPMRTIIGERYKLIYNLAYKLDYPAASDLWESPTWQASLKSENQMFGKRSIKKYMQRDQFELYDLKSDPDEVNNLAKNPEHAEVLEKMKAQLKGWQQETKDPWVLKWIRE